MPVQPIPFKNTVLKWLNPILLTLCSVILLTLSFPNFDGFYLAFIALVPLFIILERENFFLAFLCLEIFIILFYGYFMWWVKVFHPFALPGVIIYLCIIYSIPFFIYRILRKHYKNIYNPFLLASLFTIFEYLRCLGFPRFPYGILAYTQYSFLPFIQISDFTGFLGVSFLLYLTNSFTAHSLSQLEYLQEKTKQSFKTLRGILSYIVFNRIWILIILLSLNLLYGIIRLQQKENYWPQPPQTPTEETSHTSPSSPFKVTLIQPWFDYNITKDRFSILSQKLFLLTQQSIQNLPSPHKNTNALSQTNPDSEQTETYSQTPEPPNTPDIPNSEINVPDLIIWPESAIDTYYQYELENFVLKDNTIKSPYTEAMYNFLKNLGEKYSTTFLAGSFTLNPITKEIPVPQNQNSDNSKAQNSKPKLQTIVTDYEKYNAALLINEKGQVDDWSGKTYLVPFAEYFPFTTLTKKIPFIQKILDDARASQFTPYKDVKIFLKKNIPFAVLICYEDTFSDLSRIFTLAGAQFLVIITNDAWSYSDRSQNIHYAFSFFRAIENRRPVLRVGNAGVTGLIDPLGHPHHILPSFVEAFTTFSFTPQSKLTFYSSFGDWFVFLLVLFVLFLASPLVISTLFIRSFKKLQRLLSKKNSPTTSTQNKTQT